MRYLYLILLTATLVSCQPKWDIQNLTGEWKTSSWVIEDSGKSIANQMDFVFNEDKTYSIDYGTMKEVGKFWLETDYLVTVEEGQNEKKVKIIKLSQDSFLFRMNRGGRYENVTLVK